MAKRSSVYLHAFATRLGAMMAALGMSQAELGRRLAKGTGSSARELSSAVSRWCNGESLPDPEILPRLAEVLEVSLEQLLTGRDALLEAAEFGDKELPPDAFATRRRHARLIELVAPMPGKAAKSDEVIVPRLLRIAAGVPEYSPLDSDKNFIMDRRILETLTGPIPEKDPSRVVFAAVVKGDSMSPLINDKDTLIVQRYYAPMRGDSRPRIESGKLYLVNLAAADDAPDADPRIAVKRLFLGTGGLQLIVVSENAVVHPPITIDLRRVRTIQSLILGRPVNLIRPLH